MAERTWSAYVVPTEHRRINEFVGLVLATAAILLGLSLISFNPDDPSFNISRNPRFSDSTSNFVGVIGSYVADAFLQTWGLSAFMIPIFLGVYAFYWLASWPLKNFWPRFVGMVLMMVTLAGTLGMSSFHIREHIPAGGIFGTMLAENLQGALNPAGTAVVLLAAFLVSLFLSTKFSFTSAVAFAKPKLQLVSSLAERWSERRKVAKASQEAAVEKIEKKEKAPKKQIVVNEPSKTMETVEVDASPTGRGWREAPAESLIAAAIRLKPSKAPKTAAVAEFPPLSLLNGPAAAVKVDGEELRNRARLIEEKSREFDVVGSVQQIHPGPVVTTFEFKPDSGVKYSRIIGLGDDLCLALEAESVRIDRIPGKSTVGIEVPNDERATIVLRELLESAEYQQSSHRLPLALGKDITGKIVVSDLAKMPHLLAAGSTGTGKSVSINAMILSLLFHSRPDQVKMIMIDPKRLELGLYQDIPHLLVPVVTEPKIAQNALKWAVTEMETRYKKLAKRGVRNLDAYNEQIRQLPIPGLNGKEGEEEEDREPLPFIVIVIDELADLMMTAPREVEESITRLAQMARAVGIHLILATQRPSVDVITGLIKANFPSRISFRVASKVDSRTILDSNGAQQLLGRGDMLFMPPGSSRLMRVHGPLTTEEEVSAVVEFLKKQGKPVYNERILESPEERMEPGEGSGDVDELYDQAVELVLEMGKASTSVLQRRLRIGYGRAASLLDAMERNGIIGPPDGSKPRAVLISKEEHSRDN